MKLKITVEGKAYEVDVEVMSRESSHNFPGPVPAYTGMPTRTPATPTNSKAPSAPAAAAPAKAAGPADGAKVCKAQIAGTIISIKVQPGQAVEQNDTLLTLEAMKMETAVASPQAGTVKAIHISVGEAVKVGQALVEFE